MKRFLLLPSCALLAFGVLTSCQKEEKTAHQLAEELTAELQKVTDYATAEAVAPRVEVLNKRFQNASVRVFSADANALAGSDANAYADALCRLVREHGRVQASKPVTEAGGEVDDAALVCAVGVGAGVAAESSTKDQFAKGQLYTYNVESESNNNPPAFAEYYGSSKLAAALSYVATTADNGAFKFASEEDVPAIPEPVEVERAAAPDASVMPADEEPAAEEEPASDDAAVSTDDEPTADTEEPSDADDLGSDVGDVEVDDSADSETGDDVAAEEPADDAAADEEPTDDAAADEEASDDLGDEDLGGDDLGGDLDIEL
ncbi:MAG: hypothetical protein J6R92_05205 [Akkermansia sp.]|nr:hypothetical protein [Akkermansia sp.]